MSIKVMTWVWEHSTYKQTKLILLLALADSANNDGYCWPSIATIAKRVRISKRQTARLIKEMAIEGTISVVPRFTEKGRQTSNGYYVNLKEDDIAMSPSTCHGEDDIAMSGGDRHNHVMDEDDTTMSPHESSKESSLEPPKESKAFSSENSSDLPPRGPMVTGHDPEAAARASEPERDAIPVPAPPSEQDADQEAWIAELESKPPPPPAPRRTADDYRAELQKTEAQMLARAAEEPWHLWGSESKQVAARDGVSREVIQRVGHLLEDGYGLRPPWGNKPRVKHWVSGLAELYKASDGDLEVIAEAAGLLRQRDYTMSKPQSLFNTVSGIAAKRRSGGSRRRAERDGYAQYAGLDVALPQVEELTEDEALWDRVLDALHGTMTKATYNHLLLDSYPTRREDGTLTIAVRNAAAVAGLERMPAVGRCVERIEAGLRVTFEVDDR